MRQLLLIAFFVLALLITSQFVWLNQVMDREEKDFAKDLQKSLENMISYSFLGKVGGSSESWIVEEVDDEASISEEAMVYEIMPKEYSNSSLWKQIEDALADDLLEKGEIKIHNVDSLFLHHFADTALLAGYRMDLSKSGTVVDSLVRGVFVGTDTIRIVVPMGSKGIYGFKGKFWVKKSLFVRKMFLSIGLSSVAIVLVALFIGWQLIALHRSKKKLEWKQRAAGGIVHDLKSPLSYVYTMLGIFYSSEQSEIKKSQLSIAKERVGELSQRVAHTLSVFKAQDNAAVLQLAPYSLAVRCTQMMEELKHVYSEKSVTYEMQIPQELKLFADLFYFEAALRNLLDNAVKYAATPAQIKIGSNVEGGKLSLSITDNGNGIARNEQKKIFKEYYRSKNAVGKGHGIGLAFSRQMIKAHGGTIKVCSQVGEGSTFTITLPKKCML